MTAPFDYPADPHARRHGPVGYADHASFRPWLRDEFTFRCVYCLRREQWGRAFPAFAIDHFLPVAARPDLATEYDNLLYACEGCNARKGQQAVADPLSCLLADAVRVRENGVLEAGTAAAQQIVDELQLNAQDLVEFRTLWIRILQLAIQFDPPLFRRLQGFPADLPDLATLRPPNGNTRPDGVEQSHFRRRERGELPPAY